MSDYEVDILAGCKTQTDWQFVNSEEDKYSTFLAMDVQQGEHADTTLTMER
jgi:hypothetical protein